MNITTKPATVWHIAQAMKSIANKDLKRDIQGINWDNSEELGATLLVLLMSYPAEIIQALYHLNREEETLENIKAIEDGEEFSKLIEALIKNNQNNVSTFISFLGKALQNLGEVKQENTPSSQ